VVNVVNVTPQDLNKVSKRLQAAQDLDTLNSVAEEAPAKELLTDPGWAEWFKSRQANLVVIQRIPPAPEPEKPVAPAPEPEAKEVASAGDKPELDIFAVAKMVEKGREELFAVRNAKWKEITAEANKRGVYINMTSRDQGVGTIGHYLVDRILDSKAPITIEQAVDEAIEMGWTKPLERDFNQATYEALMEELDRRNLWLHSEAKILQDGSTVVVSLVSLLCRAMETKQLTSPAVAVDFAVTHSWAEPRRNRSDDDGVRIEEHVAAKAGGGGGRQTATRRKSTPR